MTLKFRKLHPNAILPTRATPSAAGLDLALVEREVIGVGDQVVLRTGLAVEIPEGWFGLIRLRSGIARRSGLVITSSSVIDSDYRGELLIPVSRVCRADGPPAVDLVAGDRVAQLVLLPAPEFEPVLVEGLGDTERGEKGFGSTGI